MTETTATRPTATSRELDPPLQADFETLDADSPFHGARRAAYDRFVALGFPTTRDEEWRYTSLKPLVGSAFRRADAAPGVTAKDLGAHAFAAADGDQLVFVNGRYRDDLSAVGSLPAGVHVGSLAAAVTTSPGTVEPYLTAAANRDGEAFTALNTAFLDDGAFVFLPKNTVLERPIQLLFVTSPESAGDATHTLASTTRVTTPRILIAAEAGSQATIIERYASLGGASTASTPTLTNAVTEIITGDDVTIDHYKVVLEDDQTFHVSNLWTRQNGPGHLTSHNFTAGGKIVRHNIEATLDAEGCDAIFNGLYLTNGSQHVDNHLGIRHLKPNCRSWEYYRGILDDRSSAVFTGRIFVAQDAQKTDAKQTNQNLLLSDHARVTTKPQLEILADDVKCTHGATIGQLEESQMFYLQARGIPREMARSLLIYAFANETISEVRVEGLRGELERILLDRLPQGHDLQGGL